MGQGRPLLQLRALFPLPGGGERGRGGRRGRVRLRVLRPEEEEEGVERGGVRRGGGGERRDRRTALRLGRRR